MLYTFVVGNLYSYKADSKINKLENLSMQKLRNFCNFYYIITQRLFKTHT